MQHRSAAALGGGFVSIERLAGIAFEVGGDFVGEEFTELGALFFADTGDAFQLVHGGRILARHGAKRRVAEDDVGGHAAFVGERATERAQTFEENLVALDIAFAARDTFRFGQIHRPRECDRCAGAEHVHAGFGYFERGEFSFGDGEVTDARQFPADRRPGGPREFFADTVSRETFVAPAADLVGVGAGENFDDVIQSDGEAAVLLDAVDAGKKLLDLKNREKDLGQRIDYLKTEDGKETELRSIYNAAKPGESVVLIIDSKNSSTTAPKEKTWWQKFVSIFKK